MAGRIRYLAYCYFIVLDQLLAIVIFGTAYLLYITNKKPNPDETISSIVGKASLNGKKWARFIEKIIDTIFFLVIGQRNHCLISIEWDE